MGGGSILSSVGHEGRVESAGVTLATAWGMNIRGGRDKSGSTEEALQWSRMDRESERWMDSGQLSRQALADGSVVGMG